MAHPMRVRYIVESSVPAVFWRAFRMAIGIGCANEATECYLFCQEYHLFCQECHPLHHYEINSNKPGFKTVFDIQPIQPISFSTDLPISYCVSKFHIKLETLR
jgi:hypothetical protein